MMNSALPPQSTTVLYQQPQQQQRINEQNQENRQPQIALRGTGQNVRRFPCMFTKQMQKKRKVWSDGVLKVAFFAGGYHGTLIDCSAVLEKSLEGKQLAPQEIHKLRCKENFEIEMENHLVEVLAPLDEAAAVAVIQPPLKLPKFAPPKQFIPPPRSDVPVAHVQGATNSNSSSGSSDFSRRGPYRVNEAELDDIWGDNSSGSDINSASATRRGVMMSATVATTSNDEDIRRSTSNSYNSNIRSDNSNNNYNSRRDNGNSNSFSGRSDNNNMSSSADSITTDTFNQSNTSSAAVVHHRGIETNSNDHEVSASAVVLQRAVHDELNRSVNNSRCDFASLARRPHFDSTSAAAAAAATGATVGATFPSEQIRALFKYDANDVVEVSQPVQRRSTATNAHLPYEDSIFNISTAQRRNPAMEATVRSADLGNDSSFKDLLDDPAIVVDESIWG